jgi:hypothetical protein
MPAKPSPLARAGGMPHTLGCSGPRCTSICSFLWVDWSKLAQPAWVFASTLMWPPWHFTNSFHGAWVPAKQHVKKEMKASSSLFGLFMPVKNQGKQN